MSNKSTFVSWIRYFDEGEGSLSGLVLETLLAYWLSLFVWLSGLEDNMNIYVCPLAILHTKGREAAIGTNFLGSLYTCLHECITYITRSLGQYDVVIHVDTKFIQMFLLECSRALLPQLI